MKRENISRNKNYLKGWEKNKEIETLTIILTKNCNLNCKYCFINRKNKNIEISLEKLKEKISKILSEVRSIKKINFYGGEPLLRFSDLKEIVEQIHSINNQITFELNTNGLLLDKKVFDFLKEKKISIITSIDGTKKTTDLFRKNKKSVYDELTKKIKFLNKLDTTINMVVTPKTINIKKNLQHLLEFGFKKIKIYPDIDYTWNEKEIEIFGKNFGKALKYYTKNYKKYHKTKIIDITNFIEATNNRGANICSQIILSNDGKIYPCKSLFSRGNKIEKKYCLPFKKIEEKRKNFLKKIKRKIEEENEECVNCPIKPFCFCPLDAFLDSELNEKKFEKKMKSLCSFSKKYYEFLGKAKDNLGYKYNLPKEYFKNYLEPYPKKEISQIWISITNECNNRCKYCFIKKKKGKIDYSILEKYLDILFLSKGVNKKIMISGGEPFTQFKIVKELVFLSMRKAKLSNKRISFNIATNGTIMDTEKINFLKKNKFQISLSIDGKKKIHDKYRKNIEKEPTFEIVKKNLFKLKKEIDEEKLCALMVVHPKEAKKISENILYLIKRLKIKNINIEPVQTIFWKKEEIEKFKYHLINIFNTLLLDINKKEPFFINSLNREIYSELIKKKEKFPLCKNLSISCVGGVSVNPIQQALGKEFSLNEIFYETKEKKYKNEGVDYEIVKIRDYFCKKMARYLIKKSKKEPFLKKYVEEATKRIFE